MQKVFIGSTSKDLHAYRQAAIDTCLKLGFFPIAMEHFEAMGKGATAGSKAKLDEADLYVGIFAFRYGYTEDGYDRSVTEIEFDHAGERDLDRLCFLADPAHSWPPDVMDVKNFPQLEAFKTRIDKSLIRAQFTTVDNFTAALMHALVKWHEAHPDPETAAAPSASAVVTGILARSAAEIPHQPPALIGRDDLLTAVSARLDRGEQVLLHGFGGMGKTALAACLAAQHLDRGLGPVLWLDGLGTASAASIFAGLARPFNAHEALARLSEGEQPQAVRTLLIQSGVKLLVLDDAWDGAALAGVLAAAPPKLAVLVTSRQRFPVNEMQEVGAVEPPHDLDLLSFYAGRDLHADPQAAALSKLLGYHPYALEIAGKTLKVDDLSPGELLKRIEDAPYALAMPEDFSTKGRESVGALLEVSLNTLDDLPRAVFLAFGALFSRRATPEMIHLFLAELPEISDETLAGVREQIPPDYEISDEDLRAYLQRMMLYRADTSLIEDALKTLQRRGLADRLPATDNAIASYRLHDLARSYAHAQTDDALQRRALDACLLYVKHYNEPSLANFAALRPELDNLLGAAKWAMQHEHYAEVERLAWDLYTQGSEFLDYGGFYTQAIDLLELAAQAAATQGNYYNQGAHITSLGIAYANLGQHQRAIECYEQVLKVARGTQNRYMEESALGNLGTSYRNLEQYQQAVECYEQALAIDREIGDKRGEGADLGNLGNAYASLEQYDRAIEYYEQALVIGREIGDKRAEGTSLGNLGICYDHLQQYERAIDYYQQALAIQREIGDQRGQGNQLNNLGICYADLGQYERALECFQQGRVIFAELGVPHLIEQTDWNIARVRAKLSGAPDENHEDQP